MVHKVNEAMDNSLSLAQLFAGDIMPLWGLQVKIL